MTGSAPSSFRAWSTLRKIVLLAVVGYAVLVIAPDTLRLVPPERLPGPGPLNRWYPLGTVGFVADNDGVVTSVEPGGPAWQSCLRKGDKIDLGRTRDRRAVNEMVFVAHGEPVTVYVSKFRDVAADQLGPCVDSRVMPRTITMQPSPETLTWPEWATLLLDQLAGFAFIALCAYLTWRHCTLQTVGLLFYAVWFNSGQYFAWYANLSDGGLVAFDVLQAIFEAAGLTGLLLFVLYFPRDTIGGWRRTAQLALPGVFLVLLGFGMAGFSNFIFGRETETLYRAYYRLTWVVYVIVVAVFAHTYWSQPTERGRIKWVLAGVIVGLPCFLFADTYEATSMLNWLEESYRISVPLAVLQFLYAVNVVVPLSMVYAIRHHRVMNVRFPLTRALVVPCAIGAAIVALHVAGGSIEKLVTTKLENIELLMGGSVGLVILLAHEPVRRGLEAILYPGWRKQEAALEDEMARLAGRDVESAERILIEVPVRVLRLTAAALFERNAHGDFELKRRFRWPEGVLNTLRAQDVAGASMGPGPRRLLETDWEGQVFPSGFEAPALAVPIMIRHSVNRVVLFGPHATGEDLARDEISLIQRFGRAAAALFDGVERRDQAARLGRHSAPDDG
jgi:hypothetical protein